MQKPVLLYTCIKFFVYTNLKNIINVMLLTLLQCSACSGGTWESFFFKIWTFFEKFSLNFSSLSISHFRIAFYFCLKTSLSALSTFYMEMCLICKKTNVKVELTSIWKLVHQDLFWNRETRKLRIGLLHFFSMMIFKAILDIFLSLLSCLGIFSTLEW